MGGRDFCDGYRGGWISSPSILARASAARTVVLVCQGPCKWAHKTVYSKQKPVVYMPGEHKGNPSVAVAIREIQYLAGD